MISVSQVGKSRLREVMWLANITQPLQPQRPPHLSIGVVCVPGGAQSLLSAYVLHEEMGFSKNNLLHIATDGGKCMDHLIHKAGKAGEDTKSSAQPALSPGLPLLCSGSLLNLTQNNAAQVD